MPFGQSIRFDKEKQEFEIPPNTRFYKTFLKKVVDDSGNERWKKIETRIIVSRPDEPLFGTYKWDENETGAELWTEPYRDATPFRDLVLNIVTDEMKAAEIRNADPTSQQSDVRAREGRDPEAICHPGTRPLHPVPHGQPELELRSRFHSASSLAPSPG